MAESVYDIPLDGSAFDLTAPFAVKTLVFVNGSNANVTVADDTGRSFTVGAGDGGPVPVLGGRHFSLRASSVATGGGTAYVIATDKRLPGAVGALTAAGGAASGVQGNLWNASVVAGGGNSAAFVVPSNVRTIAVFGHSSAATTLSLQVSADAGATWTTIDTNILTAAGDFAFYGLSLPAGLSLRLSSSGAATITATVVAG